MSKIKTKEVAQKSIKTIDTSLQGVERAKQRYISTKEKAETSIYANENTVDEYATNKLKEDLETIEQGAEKLVSKSGKPIRQGGKKGLTLIKGSTVKIKEKIDRRKEEKKNKPKDKEKKNSSIKTKKSVKATKANKERTPEESSKLPKNVTGKSVKTTTNTITPSVESVKATEENTAKAPRRAKQTIQNTEQAARKTAHAAVTGTKKVADATVKAAHAAVEAVKSLGSVIGTGGVTAVIIVVIICFIGLVASSAYGIFFSGESFDESGMTMRTAVLDINMEYQGELEKIQNEKSHDILEMKGSMAVWPEVLSVYAVKTNMDADNPQEVATMDEKKKELLSDIFWEMNKITHLSKTEVKNTIFEKDDGYGNIVQTIKPEKKTTLYIIVTHKTAKEMAIKYKFDEDQIEILNELLKDSNSALWSDVLYGVAGKDKKIVNVALSQVGNVGGKPYWSWYGFHSRVEWCACFVSWCANECGYIESGIIPKYASCLNGMNWFKERGQWIARTPNPEPGMIIFFDWNHKGGKGNQDGIPDHTGIVQKVENGKVYTVEGNAGDSCRIKSYNVNHYEILGYGMPAY